MTPTTLDGKRGIDVLHVDEFVAASTAWAPFDCLLTISRIFCSEPNRRTLSKDHR